MTRINGIEQAVQYNQTAGLNNPPESSQPVRRAKIELSGGYKNHFDKATGQEGYSLLGVTAGCTNNKNNTSVDLNLNFLGTYTGAGINFEKRFPITDDSKLSASVYTGVDYNFNSTNSTIEKHNYSFSSYSHPNSLDFNLGGRLNYSPVDNLQLSLSAGSSFSTNGPEERVVNMNNEEVIEGGVRKFTLESSLGASYKVSDNVKLNGNVGVNSDGNVSFGAGVTLFR